MRCTFIYTADQNPNGIQLGQDHVVLFQITILHLVIWNIQLPQHDIILFHIDLEWYSATTTWYCIVSHQLNNSQINTLFTPVTMGQGCWLILWGCWPTPQPWTTTITALNYHTSLYSICVANRIKSHLFPATCSSISLPLSILSFLVNRYSQQPINIIFNLKHCT